MVTAESWRDKLLGNPGLGSLLGDNDVVSMKSESPQSLKNIHDSRPYPEAPKAEGKKAAWVSRLSLLKEELSISSGKVLASPVLGTRTWSYPFPVSFFISWQEQVPLGSHAASTLHGRAGLRPEPGRAL